MNSQKMREKSKTLFSKNKRQWFKIYILFLLISIIGLSNSVSLGRVSVVDNNLQFIRETNGFILYTAFISLFTATLQFGASFKTLSIIRHQSQLEDAEYGDSLTGIDRLSNFIKFFFLELVRRVYNLLWYFLFIIPGFVKMYSYSMTELIYYDAMESGQTIDYAEAVTQSRQLMDGHKWDLFKLDLGFRIAIYLVELGFALLSSFMIALFPFLGAILVLVLSIFVTILVCSLEIRKNIARISLFEALKN